MRWTKDGVAILVHDAGTTPGMECEGGNLTIAETDWSVLDATSAGPRRSRRRTASSTASPPSPRGSAAVAKVPGAEIYPEVKVEQGARQTRHFVETIKNARMIGRTVVTSSFPDELAKIQAEAEAQGESNLRTMLFVSGQRPPAAQLAARATGRWPSRSTSSPRRT